MEEEQLKKHSLGLCAMKKKIHSPHMQQILDFIKEFNDFDLIEFTEEMIFNKDVEEWPIVESMIVFYSTGFPYSKVLKYINLRKPFLPNDFEIQKVFWDRIKVMNLLKENNIPIPNGIIVERESEINNENKNSIELNTSQEIEEMIKEYNEEYNGFNKPKAPNLEDLVNNEYKSEESNSVKLKKKKKIITKNEDGEEIINELEEYDEYIVYNGKKIMKPFVEKPKNGDDHNIYIYYPMNHGGGQTRLFRKHKNLSSLYYPNINKIRRDKSYLYEEYLQTDGFDIKVYTVGENYAHAEERKSPSLDGKVERNNGKEVRYPVNLTPAEKNIARKIVQIFKQNICGFDILRSKGVSYVCDVNGWSFVKGNRKYFQDCAILLRKIILSVIDPGLLTKHPINIQTPPVYKEMILDNKNGEKTDELRSVVAVFRHADRSPKQKLKVVVQEPSLLELFDLFEDKEKKNETNKPEELKLKKPKELMTVLRIVKTILEKKGINGDELPFQLDNFEIKLFQIKLILERNLNFEGLTRKIQLRPLEWTEVIDKYTSKKSYKITKALLIMKWGGHITHSGIEQAKILGQTFRSEFYPSSGKGEGLLRLHNTYRHDLKCYSSEEGRCLKSAAAFLQGLLQLEGNLIQIIYSMVWKDEKINKLLDVDSTSIETNRKEVKFKLNEFCNYNGHLKEKYTKYVSEDNMILQNPFIKKAEKIDNFHSKMMKVYEQLENIIKYLSTRIDEKEKEKEDKSYFIKSKKSILSRYDSSENINNVKKEKKKITPKGYSDPLKGIKIIDDSPKNDGDTCQKNISKNKKNKFFDCEEEKVILIYKRYFKLYNDFYDKKKNKFDISKIPDIYDNIKYDIIHNKTIIGETAIELYQEITILAEFVMPLEYGIKIDEKINIGIKFIKPLLSKIYNDLLWVLNFEGSNSFISNKSNSTLSLSDNDDTSIKDLQSLESQERTYFGLDEEKLDKGEIKSAWRHVKTRIYFTSQSHLYSLLNTLIYGDESFLIKNRLEENNPILSIFDLDYCSHIVFRLFEKYNVDKKSKDRYRIEIIVSPGANKNITEYNDNKHLIPLDTWWKINNDLSLPDFQKFFNYILRK